MSAPKSGLDSSRQPRWTLRSRLTRFAFGSTLVTGLAVAAIAVTSTYTSLREQVAQTHAIVLGWSAERVRASFDQGVSEIEHLVWGNALEPWRSAAATSRLPRGSRDRALTQILSRELADFRMFSSLLVLAPDGTPRAAVGSGPTPAALVEALEPSEGGNPRTLRIAATSPSGTRMPRAGRSPSGSSPKTCITWKPSFW